MEPEMRNMDFFIIILGLRIGRSGVKSQFYEGVTLNMKQPTHPQSVALSNGVVAPLGARWQFLLESYALLNLAFLAPFFGG